MAITTTGGAAGTTPPTNNTPAIKPGPDQGNITTPNAADLNTAARKYCTARGWAMQGGSYPIRPANNHGADDLDKAIHAVGRGGASGNTIRKFIIGRAHAIGLADEIPNTWSATGQLVSAGHGDAGGMRAGALTGMRSVATGTLERTQYRFAADLELRAGGDGRTIVGIAVPYNQIQRIDDHLIEAFDPHSLDHQIRAMHRVGYWNLHSVHGGSEVGHIKYARNDASGLYTESFISPDDPNGDRTLDEIRSGKLPHQSVGFDVLPGGTQYRDGVAYRTKVNMIELAAVPEGAYGAGAAVTGVRAVAGAAGLTDTGGAWDAGTGGDLSDGDVCPVCGHDTSTGDTVNTLDGTVDDTSMRAGQLRAAVAMLRVPIIR